MGTLPVSVRFVLLGTGTEGSDFLRVYEALRYCSRTTGPVVVGWSVCRQTVVSRLSQTGLDLLILKEMTKFALFDFPIEGTVEMCKLSWV